MRHVLSVSVKEETILELRDKLRHNKEFRKKSHFVEYAIKKALKELEPGRRIEEIGGEEDD